VIRLVLAGLLALGSSGILPSHDHFDMLPSIPPIIAKAPSMYDNVFDRSLSHFIGRARVNIEIDDCGLKGQNEFLVSESRCFFVIQVYHRAKNRLIGSNNPTRHIIGDFRGLKVFGLFTNNVSAIIRDNSGDTIPIRMWAGGLLYSLGCHATIRSIIPI
jgi:hypothetical protein